MGLAVPAQSLAKFYGPLVGLHSCYKEHAQQRSLQRLEVLWSLTANWDLFLVSGSWEEPRASVIYRGQTPPSYELLWVQSTSGGLGEQLGWHFTTLKMIESLENKPDGLALKDQDC